MIGSGRLADLLQRPGDWTYAFVDGRGGEPQVIEESRRDDVRRRLLDAGAPEPDAEAVASALERNPGLPAPSARYLLVQDGDVVVDEPLPGERVGPEVIGRSPIPPVLPLLRARGADIRYLVVEAGRGDAEVRLERAGREPDWSAEVEGRTDALPKVQAGGWSHGQYQRNSEEIWKHNQSDLATLLDRLVRRHAPAFLVVAGDVRARQLLVDQLGAPARDLVIEVDAHTHAAGSDRAALDAAIEAAIEAHAHDAERRIADDASADHGRSGARGTGDVVEALAQARVERLLLDARMPEAEQTLDALGEAPWIAVGDTGALGVGTLGRIPAAEALARAALLTGAEVVVEEEQLAPGQERRERAPREPVAVLRWPDPGQD